ncbi:VOC family protein [Chloroflexota bacterium]
MTDEKTVSPFSKVIQVGLVVRDVEKTVERLTSIGIGPFTKMQLPPEREEWNRGEPMYAEFKMYSAMMGDIQIELIQPLSGNSPHMEFLNTTGEGIHHIACAVPDVQEAVDHLAEKNVDVLMRAKFPGDRGVAYMDLGTANFLVELIQRKE